MSSSRFRNRTAWANLLFSMTAVASAAFTLFELWMMRAQTPEELGRAMRWGHVVVFFWIASIAGFVRLYLGAGRPGLAWTVCSLRGLSLLPNFGGRTATTAEPQFDSRCPSLPSARHPARRDVRHRARAAAEGGRRAHSCHLHHRSSRSGVPRGRRGSGGTAYFRKTDSGTDVLEAIRRAAV